MKALYSVMIDISWSGLYNMIIITSTLSKQATDLQPSVCSLNPQLFCNLCSYKGIPERSMPKTRLAKQVTQSEPSKIGAVLKILTWVCRLHSVPAHHRFGAELDPTPSCRCAARPSPGPEALCSAGGFAVSVCSSASRSPTSASTPVALVSALLNRLRVVAVWERRNMSKNSKRST